MAVSEVGSALCKASLSPSNSRPLPLSFSRSSHNHETSPFFNPLISSPSSTRLEAFSVPRHANRKKPRQGFLPGIARNESGCAVRLGKPNGTKPRPSLISPLYPHRRPLLCLVVLCGMAAALCFASREHLNARHTCVEKIFNPVGVEQSADFPRSRRFVLCFSRRQRKPADKNHCRRWTKCRRITA